MIEASRKIHVHLCNLWTNFNSLRPIVFHLHPLIMAYDTALADRVTDMLHARRVSFETKAMMGGLCFMVNGKMCVGVEKARLMVRLDPAVEADALPRPGCKPMDFTGRPMKGYVFVHPEGYQTEAQLRHWLELALDFNPRAKASKKKPKPAR